MLGSNTIRKNLGLKGILTMLSNRSILERIGTSVATIFSITFPEKQLTQTQYFRSSLAIQAMASDWTSIVAMAFINEK